MPIPSLVCCSRRLTRCRAPFLGGQLKGLAAGTVGVLVCGVIYPSIQGTVTWSLPRLLAGCGGQELHLGNACRVVGGVVWDGSAGECGGGAGGSSKIEGECTSSHMYLAI